MRRFHTHWPMSTRGCSPVRSPSGEALRHRATATNRAAPTHRKLLRAPSMYSRGRDARTMRRSQQNPPKRCPARRRPEPGRQQHAEHQRDGVADVGEVALDQHAPPRRRRSTKPPRRRASVAESPRSVRPARRPRRSSCRRRRRGQRPATAATRSRRPPSRPGRDQQRRADMADRERHDQPTLRHSQLDHRQ